MTADLLVGQSLLVPFGKAPPVLASQTNLLVALIRLELWKGHLRAYYSQGRYPTWGLCETGNHDINQCQNLRVSSAK